MAIQSRIEIPAALPEPDYAGKRFGAKQIAAGVHRTHVGGRWEELGALQVDFLELQGLRPHHRLLDVGCGSLRAGRLLVERLEPGGYYGIDINRELIEAGYEHELTATQRHRLPSENLRVADRFDVDFGVTFDMAIAQSVFTHISLNSIRLCLERVAGVMRPGGCLFASFFPAEPDRRLEARDGVRFSERNPYWYYPSDLEWAAGFGGWTTTYVGEWGHPVGQHMMRFTKRTAPDRRAPARLRGLVRSATRRANR